MDLSPLNSNDPAGLQAEKLIKRRIALACNPDADPSTWERADYAQGRQQNPGSIAASDSGQFHAYRKNRRHELDRIEAFENARKLEQEQREFQRELEQKKAIEEAKTAKRRAKRQRKQLKKLQKTEGQAEEGRTVVVVEEEGEE